MADLESEVSKDEQSIMAHCLKRLTATEPYFSQKKKVILVQNNIRSQGFQNAWFYWSLT